MPEFHSQRVASAVRAEMARSQVSRAAVAEVLGVHVQSVARRLTGEVPFRVTELYAIAPLLNVDAADLLPTVDDNARVSA